tara:strand:+ start:5539 stop:5985 length:447 start_codon:yes stop_codon:yes gene_type:complete
VDLPSQWTKILWKLFIILGLCSCTISCTSLKPLLPPSLAVVGGGVGALGGSPVTAGLGAGLGAGAGYLIVQGSDKVDSEVRVLKALTTGDVNAVVTEKLKSARDEGFFDHIFTEIYGVLKLCVIGLALWILVPMVYTHWQTKKIKNGR